MQTPRKLLRDNQLLRNALAPVLALGRNEASEKEWLICPMYHDFGYGEKARFAAQLRYMRSLGDFIGLDDAVQLLQRKTLGGRYFTVTVDDGYWGAYQNGYPVLAEANVPAAFFVVPDWIDSEMCHARDVAGKFVTWDACRMLARQGVIIGSHTQSHARLAELRPEQVAEQMTMSRDRIENEVAAACHHFACPWGQPGRDYISQRDPFHAKEAGYRSFLTTIRARAKADSSPFALPRIRVEPNWNTHQLKYMFFR